MIWADCAILAIIGLSALISIWRGLIREVLSLYWLIVATLVAVTFMRPLADQLTPYISVASVRLIIAFMALFIATLLCGAIINFIIAKLVMSSGLCSGRTACWESCSGSRAAPSWWGSWCSWPV